MLEWSHAVRASDTSSRYTPTRAIVSGCLLIPNHRCMAMLSFTWCASQHPDAGQIARRSHAQKAEEAVSRVSTRRTASPPAPRREPRPLTSDDARVWPQLHAFATHFLPSRHQEHHGNSTKGYREYTIRAMWSHNAPNAAIMSGTRSRVTAQKNIGRCSLFSVSPNSPRQKTRIQQDA